MRNDWGKIRVELTNEYEYHERVWAVEHPTELKIDLNVFRYCG